MSDHDAVRVFRIGALTRMFAAYGIVPDENRLTTYLAVLAPIPDDRLAEALTAGMAESDGSFPPGPGQIIAAWKAAREARPEERPYRGSEVRQGSAAIETGAAMTAIEARIEPGDEKQILAVARELRVTHAQNFPAHPNEARTPSLVAAAMKLGRHWPMQADHARQVAAWMQAAADEGRKTAWWGSEKRARTTEWRDSYYAGVVAR